MTSFWYAQIDENNILVVISKFHSTTNSSNMILLASEDAATYGQYYNDETEQFEDV